MQMIYNFLIYLLMPLVLIRLFWRARTNPEHTKHLTERFGQPPSGIPKGGIWVHAVSVGETVAAGPLVKALRQQYPDTPLYFTNHTLTGRQRAESLYGGQVTNIYSPYDLPVAVNHFVATLKPKLLILLESQLWPNYLNACQKSTIPVVVVNARISPPSFQRYRRMKRFVATILQKLTHVAAQSEIDAAHYQKLGVPVERITMTGNLKFAVKPPENLAERRQYWRDLFGAERLIWVAASTHPTEEDIVLAAHREILKAIPNAILLLVPRHPERFDTVTELAKADSWQTQRRSENKAVAADTQVVIGDSMGELFQFYALADVAFVAGSFVAVGGHNILEPVSVGCPTITGPQMFNFKEITEKLLAANALVQVQSADTLAQAVIRLSQNQSEREQIIQNGLDVVARNQDSIDKTLMIIKQYI
jgi:3-deoxy-D-manno-octulosonic-acid transferase